MASKKAIFHAQIVNKGVRAFSNLTVMCEILKMKESSQQLSMRAKSQGGYPIVGYSTLAKAKVIVTRLLVETRSTEVEKEYEKLEVSYEVDYIDPNDGLIIDVRKKSLENL